MREQWLPVVGFPFYDVSNLGRVRSWRGNGNGTRAKKSKVLLGTLGTNGRYKYELCRGIKGNPHRSETKYEHKLVAEAFIGPGLPGQEVRHLDGNKVNNRLDNLVYGSTAENIEDKRRHGTFIQGSKSNFSKLSEAAVKDIRKSDLSIGELADRYGVSKGNIYLILSNKTWRHVT